MDEQHWVDTPEQVALEFPIASLGSRGLALIIDTVCQVAAVAVLLVLLTLLVFLAPALRVPAGGAGAAGVSPTWVLAIVVLIAFVLYWGYFALFEFFWRGQTPGKRLMKIRVLQQSGRAMTAFEALTRNLLRAVDMLPTMYAVGIVVMLLNRDAQRLGDLAAGTIVVHEPRQELPLGAAHPSVNAAGEAGWATQHLTLVDLNLIETFLHRRMQLEPEVRRANAGRIAAHLAKKLGHTRGDGADEAYLEEVARQMRAHAGFMG